MFTFCCLDVADGKVARWMGAGASQKFHQPERHQVLIVSFGLAKQIGGD